MTLFFTLWTPSAILAAALVGLGIGLALALFPAMIGSERSTILAPSRAGLVAAALVVWLGSAFYAGQGVDSYLSADPGLPRVVSRWALWLLFSVAVGIGVWIGLAARVMHR